MNKPHKWAKEIKAWADGATIQLRYKYAGGWSQWEIVNAPHWHPVDTFEYRVKPDPTVLDGSNVGICAFEVNP